MFEVFVFLMFILISLLIAKGFIYLVTKIGGRK